MSKPTTTVTATELVVNGVKYVPEGTPSAPPPTGTRVVLVISSGWIYAGDVEEVGDRIRLRRAAWVFKWADIGFAGVIANPKSSKADIRPLPAGLDTVDVPKHAEVYRIPVPDNWGL